MDLLPSTSDIGCCGASDNDGGDDDGDGNDGGDGAARAGEEVI